MTPVLLNAEGWFYGSIISNSIGKIAISCSEREWTTFALPDGETCRSYAGAFLEKAAGYVENLDATGSCRYCRMSSGEDYLQQIGFSWDHRWRYALTCGMNSMPRS